MAGYILSVQACHMKLIVCKSRRFRFQGNLISATYKRRHYFNTEDYLKASSVSKVTHTLNDFYSFYKRGSFHTVSYEQ